MNTNTQTVENRMATSIKQPQTKVPREAFTLPLDEKVILDKALAYHIKEKGYGSAPKRSALVRDIVMAWANETVRRNEQSPDLFTSR